MASDSKKFLLDINSFVDKTNMSMVLTKKDVAREVFKRIIQRTPIWRLDDNPGKTKGNWTASNGRPSSGELQRMDPSGEITIAAMASVIERVTADKSVFLSNSSPHIWKLEEGKYPIGGEGSYNPTTNTYEKRSTGGWSNQLLEFGPAGMVKVTIAEFEEIVNQVARKFKVRIS